MSCGNGGAMDSSQGTYYLPVILHKDLTTGDLIKRTAYNAYSDSPIHTIGTTTETIVDDYNNIVNVQEYNYVGISKGSSDSDKNKPDINATEITTDENNLYVTFWYQKGPATATINYQVVGESSPRYTETVEIPEDGIDVSRFTTYDGQNYNQKLIDAGCIYKGLVRNDKSGKYPKSGFAEEDSSNLTDRGTVLTFWYQETKVKIIYRTDMNILDSGEYTLTKDETYYPKDGSCFGKGYEYRGYEITKPDPQPYKDAEKTEGVPVKFDGEYHEIIFYYVPHVTIKVVGVSVREVKKDKFDYKAIPGAEKIETKEITGTEQKYTYSHLDEDEFVDKYGNKVLEGYEYLEKYTVVYGTNSYGAQKPESPDNDKGATVTVVEKAGEKPCTMILIAFYYDADLLKIYHINEETNENLVDPRVADLIKSPVPVDSVTTQFQNYVNSKVTLTETDILDQNSKAENEITPDGFRKYGKNKYTVTVTPDGKDYTLKFYYLKYDITVNHHLIEFDSNGNQKIIETRQGTYDISETGEISSYSITGTDNYLNWNVKIKDKTGKEVTPKYMIGSNVVEEPREYGPEQYKVVFDIASNEYTIDFYYVKQQLEVRHVWEDGDNDDTNDELIEKAKITYLPATEMPLDKDSNGKPYNCVSWVLNGTSTDGKPTSVYVEPNPIYGAKQILIFKYSRDPIIIPGTLTSGTRIEPNNINNQLINKENGKYYWVLDNDNHELKLHIDAEASGGTSITGSTAKIKIPFDVYINNSLKKKDTPLEVTMSSASEGKISNIFVPVWTDEIEHTITADLTVNYKYQTYDETTGTITDDNFDSVSGEATGKVTVVGRVYDFSITNVEGDDKWKESLFRETKIEHEADTLPIGQDNGYQPSKYVTGILKGANIYFSLNTKGEENSSIKITPSFYHISQDGNTIQPVDLYSNGKKISESRAIPLSRNEYRESSEYGAELLKAEELYPNVKYEEKVTIGNATGLVLKEQSRTPYLGYLDETEYSNIKENLPTGVSEESILEEVSHWYGNYSIPNDAVAYVKGSDPSNATKLTSGFIVVYFNIVTQRVEGANKEDYLAYNLSSPKSSTGKSQWVYERTELVGETEENYNDYTLPKVSAKQTTKKEVSPWLNGNTESGAVAVIIYDDTPSSYTTVGTH